MLILVLKHNSNKNTANNPAKTNKVATWSAAVWPVAEQLRCWQKIRSNGG